MVLGSFFFSNNNFAKTQYKTYDNEILAIVKTFPTLKHYLKDYKYKVLVLTNQNNL